MERPAPTAAVPSNSTCSVSGRARGGYIYDDNAQEIPHVRENSEFVDATINNASSKRKKPVYITVFLAIVVFLVQLGSSIADVPSTRLLEEIICQLFYGDRNDDMIAEGKCAINAVQGELNIITTVALILGYLPGILVAVPFGILSDRYGRKVVLSMSILGMTISQFIWIGTVWNGKVGHWNLRYVWSSSAALLIGGGESLAEAMVFAMISDVTREDKRQQPSHRALYFQVQICAVLLAEAIAPFFASLTMLQSVWTPILLSPCIMMVGLLLLILAVPETVNIHALREQEQQRGARTRNITPTYAHRVSRLFDGPPPSFSPSSTKPWTHRFRGNITATVDMLRTQDVKLLIPTASLTIPIATITMSIALRYMPLRFGWSLADTGMVLGMRTAINIIVLLGVLPVTSYLFSRWTRLNRDIDLVLAQMSAALLVIGQSIFAASPGSNGALAGLVILTFGTGAPSLCRAALTRIVARESIGHMFGVLAVCEMIGYLCFGVGFGALFQVSITMGLTVKNEEWCLALVFYVAAVAYFCCGGMLWVVDAKTFADREEMSGDAGGPLPARYEMRVISNGRITRRVPIV